MASPVKAGVPILGVIFLALAVFKFFTDGGWIVWLILGALFGGFGIFSANRSQGIK
ncbi:hypothetical protein AB5I39_15915 [Sphingomonas sp. MMS24-J45]|uniref:hypothetical protein n=1 Tax=Sphingomonas sp. MMS24-J45 TaxID=3238806 RepID=UPI00384FD013